MSPGDVPNELPILRVDPSDLSDIAIVVGDPDRAKQTASLLDDATQLASSREYHTFAGSKNGTRLIVASHGVGASGANICFSELVQAGVRTLIRAGTCGAIIPGLGDGAHVIATGAVREDGASDQMIDLAYPAVVDRTVTEALSTAARSHGIAAQEGLVVTEANFYPGAYPPRWQKYNEYGAIAVEMELSAMLVLAGMNGVRAGAILTVDGNLVDEKSADMSDYDPHRTVVRDGVRAMLEVAVEAASTLSPS